jgi:hypothetical protein
MLLDVEIDDWIYTGVLEDSIDGNQYVLVFHNWGEDSEMFMGKLLLRGDDLVEVFIMSNTEAIVGKIIR